MSDRDNENNFGDKKKSTEDSVDFRSSELSRYRERKAALEKQLSESTLGKTRREVEKEIELLRKACEKPLEHLNLEGDFGKNYREYRDPADRSLIEEDGIFLKEKTKDSAIKPTNIKHKEIILKSPKLLAGVGKLKELQGATGEINFSTPLTGTRDHCRSQFKELLNLGEPFTPVVGEEVLRKIKQQLSVEIKREVLESYLEQEEVQKSIKEILCSIERVIEYLFLSIDA